MDEEELWLHVRKILKTHRVNNNLSITELSKRLGNSPSKSAISNFERGTQSYKLITIYRICKVLNVTIHDVLPKELFEHGKQLNLLNKDEL